jgi:hypothetical protein
LSVAEEITINKIYDNHVANTNNGDPVCYVMLYYVTGYKPLIALSKI